MNFTLELEVGCCVCKDSKSNFWSIWHQHRAYYTTTFASKSTSRVSCQLIKTESQILNSIKTNFKSAQCLVKTEPISAFVNESWDGELKSNILSNWENQLQYVLGRKCDIDQISRSFSAISISTTEQDTHRLHLLP